jgi:hypothetical protein
MNRFWDSFKQARTHLESSRIVYSSLCNFLNLIITHSIDFSRFTLSQCFNMINIYHVFGSLGLFLILALCFRLYSSALIWSSGRKNRLVHIRWFVEWRSRARSFLILLNYVSCDVSTFSIMRKFYNNNIVNSSFASFLAPFTSLYNLILENNIRLRYHFLSSV